MQNANFFFQNLTLGYMTKTLNQIFFFSLHQNQNIFFSNIGNQNIFLEKNHNPPLQVKWSFPKVSFLENNNIMFYKLYSEFFFLPAYLPIPKSVGRVWANWNIFNGGLSNPIIYFIGLVRIYSILFPQQSKQTRKETL